MTKRTAILISPSSRVSDHGGRPAPWPALIATFYTWCAETYAPDSGTNVDRPLPFDTLYQALSGKKPTPETLDWIDTDRKEFLSWFVPATRGQEDTLAVQLAIHAPGTAASAWPLLRARLAELIGGADFRIAEAHDAAHFIGYTLVYQATFPESTDPAESFGECGIDQFRLDANVDLAPLAEGSTRDARTWLLDIPVQGEGLAAATIYAVMNSIAKDDEFMSDVLYGETASLFVPDLLAHKAYFLLRAFDAIHKPLSLRQSEILRLTSQLLDRRSSTVLGEDLIESLSTRYDVIASRVPRIIDTRISLDKQIFNFDESAIHPSLAPVLSFHRRKMRAGTLEMSLLVESLRSSLEAARTAIDTARLRVDRARLVEQERMREDALRREAVEERRQRRFELVLALLALGLSIPQIVDQGVASQWMETLGIPGDGDAISGGTTDLHYSSTALLIARVVIAIGILLLLVAGHAVWSALRRDGHEDAGDRR